MPTPKRNAKGLKGLIHYLRRPRTLKEIQQKFQISERSAYRWLDYLSDEGHFIARHISEEVYFFIMRSVHVSKN